MLRRLAACLALVAVYCSVVHTVAGIKITGLDREVRKTFCHASNRDATEVRNVFATAKRTELLCRLRSTISW